MLKKKCPAVDTVVQYKAGAGGALLWSQMNTLPGDGVNIVGINLPHIVLQPMEGNVAYKTDDVTPVFWFHYTPDVLVVAEAEPIKSFADFVKTAKANPGKLNLGGSGLNSANHAAHERLDRDFGVKTTYVPYKGTGDLAIAVLGGHIDGAMTYTPFAIANKGKVRALAVAMDKRHPLLPDVPTFKELGVDWVDGAYPRHRRAEVDVAAKRAPPLRPVRRTQRRPRDEGAGGEGRLRAGQRRPRRHGRLHAHPHQGLHRRRQADGPGHRQVTITHRGELP